MERSNYVITNPVGIEKSSMEIIQSELSHLQLPEDLAPLIKRVIHTTADFEYAQLFEAHPDAIANAQRAIKASKSIYADTSMIVAGMSKPSLNKYGCSIQCYVHDPEVVKKAKELDITRSIAGMDKACENPDNKIFVIGNAPTALVRLCELYKEGKVQPELVVGVPVGFVGAAESKEMLKESGMPYIIIRGRKGGSTVGVAIMNAILYGMREE